ncbi:MAG: GDP-L-fucose synthase [Cellvibrionaceae bacterium]
MNKDSKIYIAGHNGMVGSAILSNLTAKGYHNICTASRKEVDLCNQAAVADYFEKEKPSVVFLAAAKVGGILANKTKPAEFIYENLMIENNIIHQSYLKKVDRLVFLGSSCIYPKFATQPITEDQLLTGILEPTNEPYAIAKITGIKLCESYNRQYGTDYRSVMPTNLYGPNDNFDLESSHVIPALIRKVHEAKLANASSVEIWGSGKPFREFLHVDDMAEACIHVAGLSKTEIEEHTETTCSHINIGYGEDITIGDLADVIKDVVGFSGKLDFDTSKPDGTPKKLLSIEKAKSLGWKPKIDLESGLKSAYEWYIDNS